MLPLEAVQPDEPDVAVLIDRHFALMREQSPPESCHVFSVEALRADDICLFALRKDGKAVSIGAIKVDGQFGELKSMHTAAEERGKGLARSLLQGLIEKAGELGVTRLALETGSGASHLASRGLYASEGFQLCAPFGTYVNDPLSLFMERHL